MFVALRSCEKVTKAVVLFTARTEVKSTVLPLRSSGGEVERRIKHKYSKYLEFVFSTTGDAPNLQLTLT